MAKETEAEGTTAGAAEEDATDCTRCGEPAHASDTDDHGRCVSCIHAAGDEVDEDSSWWGAEAMARRFDSSDAYEDVGGEGGCAS